MVNVTGLAPTGREQALLCNICGGDACAKPAEHLVRASDNTIFIKPHEPVLMYAEVNKWGYRWRVVKIARDSQIRAFVDVMGPDLDEQTFFIPGGDPDEHPSLWETFSDICGLARDYAAWREKTPKKWNAEAYLDERTGEKHAAPDARPSTAKEWAVELLERRERREVAKKARSMYGPIATIQRS